MDKWDMMRLGDIGESFIGLTYKPENIVDDGIIVLRSGNVQNNAIDLTDIVRVDKVPKNKLLVKDGDILMCSRNGSANLVGKSTMISNLPENMTFGAFMMIYRSKSNPYITHFFHSPYFKRQLTKSATTTINQITKSMLDEVKIPLPPLDEQKRIAKNLDLASEIVKGYKEQLAELDKLVQSMFYDMFGDPVTNEKGWKKNSFADVCKVRQGLQIPISERKTSPAENRYVYITVQYLNGRKNAQYIENPKASVICSRDDVLMTRTGNTGLVVTNVEGVFHNNFFLIDFNRNIINKTYLVKYLELDVIRAELLLRAGNSTIPDLNHSEFYKVAIPTPPLPLQTRFASIVTEIETQKAQVQQALTETEILFNSLMQEYFE